MYAYEPAGTSGVRALRRQIRGRGSSASPDVLGPVTALRELDAVCDGMLSGRSGPNHANRASLVEDLQHSLNQLGPLTRQAAHESLGNFQSELGRLKMRLDTPSGARVLKLQIGELLARLDVPEVVAAAWRDTVRTFLDDDTTAETCELRVAQLTELAEHRGVDYAAWSQNAEMVLGDHAPTLKFLGEPVVEQPEGKEHVGGVTEDRRIDVCEEQLAKLPGLSQIVVWLVIDNAALPNQFLQLGPIWLFDGRYWTEDCATGDIASRIDPGLPVPPEFDNWAWASQEFARLPAAEHRVYARMTLEDTMTARARARARRVLHEMIDLAKSDSDWVLLDGALSWRQTGWSGESYSAPKDTDTHPVHERTATELQRFETDFIQRWVESDPLVAEGVADALWAIAVERAPATSQRIMLALRTVERVLGQARETPHDNAAAPAERFLRALWVNDTLSHEIRDAVFAAHSGVENNFGPTDLKNRLLVMVTGPSSWHDLFANFLSVAPDALAALTPGSMAHRIVRDAVDVLTSPEKALTRLKELGQHFDRLLARSERQRNALVHGTGTTDAALRSVDMFVRVLANYAAGEALGSAEGRKQPLVALEQRRIQALEHRARLECGEAPLEVLWPAR
jgi:hypothetical protein